MVEADEAPSLRIRNGIVLCGRCCTSVLDLVGAHRYGKAMEHAEDAFTVHEGDARQLTRILGRLGQPKEPFLTCTITSPPYGPLKNYGHPDQIGFGQPYDEYLVDMRRVFRSIYQWTKDDGSMWVISDTLRSDDRRGDQPTALEPLPFQLAQEASEAGWVLRDSLIWQKHKTLPWSSGKRLRNVFEHIMLFVKSNKYKFHSDRLRDPEHLEQWWVKWPERYNPNGKVPTNVWSIPVPQQGSWGSSLIQHACPLPADLVERLLFLSTDEGDVVLDPFAGSGVVVAEANRLGRRGFGIELNRKYVRAYRTTVAPIVAQRSERDVVRERMELAQDLRRRILCLRAMKYPKVLWRELAKEGGHPLPDLVIALMGKIKDDTLAERTKLLPVKVLFIYRQAPCERVDAVGRALKTISNRAPAAKFGVEGEVYAGSLDELSVHVRAREKLFLYDRGRTWDAVRRLRRTELADVRATFPLRKNQHNYPAIVGNVEVHEVPGERP